MWVHQDYLCQSAAQPSEMYIILKIFASLGVSVELPYPMKCVIFASPGVSVELPYPTDVPSGERNFRQIHVEQPYPMIFVIFASPGVSVGLPYPTDVKETSGKSMYPKMEMRKQASKCDNTRLSS